MSSYAYDMNGYYGIGAVNGPPGYYALGQGLGSVDTQPIIVEEKQGMGFLGSLLLLGVTGGAAYGVCHWLNKRKRF